jgi:serine/threonine-protein kinase RsbW
MDAGPTGRSLEAVRCFPSRIDAVGELLDWMDGLRRPTIPEAVWVQAQTALVEGFTNAVRHAHAPFDPPPPVRVHLLCRPGELRIEVEDAGALFALRADAPEPEGSGGWGLILLRRLEERHGWRITYEPRAGGGNVLRLRRALMGSDTEKSSG